MKQKFWTEDKAGHAFALTMFFIACALTLYFVWDTPNFFVWMIFLPFVYVLITFVCTPILLFIVLAALGPFAKLYFRLTEHRDK